MPCLRSVIVCSQEVSYLAVLDGMRFQAQMGGSDKINHFGSLVSSSHGHRAGIFAHRRPYAWYDNDDDDAKDEDLHLFQFEASDRKMRI